MGMGDMLAGMEMVMGSVVDMRSRVGREIELLRKVYSLGIECRLWRVQCT